MDQGRRVFVHVYRVSVDLVLRGYVCVFRVRPIVYVRPHPQQRVLTSHFHRGNGVRSYCDRQVLRGFQYRLRGPIRSNVFWRRVVGLPFPFVDHVGGLLRVVRGFYCFFRAVGYGVGVQGLLGLF